MHINGEHRINPRHAKWVAYVQEFTFVICHKSGSQNKVADALSRRIFLLTSMYATMTAFEALKEQYAHDPDFGKFWAACQAGK